MRYSIIIPALNEEKYIGNLLECLTRQAMKDFEVIVVDGKSEDKTIEVANSFNGKLDLKIVAADKRGVAYQRNLGASKALADEFIFFDADTKIKDDFLEDLETSLRRGRHDVVTSYQEPQGEKKFDRLAFGLYNLWMDLMKKVSPSGAGAFVWCRKNAFMTVKGFDEKITSLEDCDFFKRIAKVGFKFDVLKEPKYLFSVRRLESEGRFRYFKKLMWNSVKYYLTGRDPQMEYEWGKF